MNSLLWKPISASVRTIRQDPVSLYNHKLCRNSNSVSQNNELVFQRKGLSVSKFCETFQDNGLVPKNREKQYCVLILTQVILLRHHLILKKFVISMTYRSSFFISYWQKWASNWNFKMAAQQSYCLDSLKQLKKNTVKSPRLKEWSK